MFEASFLSRYIGNIHGQLHDDPFMEILQRQGSQHPNSSLKVTDIFDNIKRNDNLPTEDKTTEDDRNVSFCKLFYLHYLNC